MVKAGRDPAIPVLLSLRLTLRSDPKDRVSKDEAAPAWETNR